MPARHRHIAGFIATERGAITEFALLLFICMMILGGLAMDMSHLLAARNQLQVAADSAAHAALYTRDTQSEADAKAKAIEIASAAMPYSVFGDFLVEDDIQFGTWDRDTQVFTAQPGSKQAVFISTNRLEARGNGVSSFLLQLIGFDIWDVRAGSVFETYKPTCLREGFVAETEVDIQSNNVFTTGFCIHSNSTVSMNNDNTFEPGSIVSMPYEGDLSLPASGFGANPGLEAAMRSGSYNLRILNRLETIITGLSNFDPDYLPSYITSVSTVTLTGNKIAQANLQPGHVHTMQCSGGGQVTIESGTNLSGVVLITNCKLKFDAGVIAEDTIIATTNTDARSMNAPSGFRIGRDDNCSAGGGAQLLTLGGISFASAMEIYGGQLLAIDDVTFTANADGVEGASIISGGIVSGTANMNMGFCNGAGMESNFEAEYFRLAA